MAAIGAAHPEMRWLLITHVENETVSRANGLSIPLIISQPQIEAACKLRIQLVDLYEQTAYPERIVMATAMMNDGLRSPLLSSIESEKVSVANARARLRCRLSQRGPRSPAVTCRRVRMANENLPIESCAPVDRVVHRADGFKPDTPDSEDTYSLTVRSAPRAQSLRTELRSITVFVEYRVNDEPVADSTRIILLNPMGTLSAGTIYTVGGVALDTLTADTLAGLGWLVAYSDGHRDSTEIMFTD